MSEDVDFLTLRGGYSRRLAGFVQWIHILENTFFDLVLVRENLTPIQRLVQKMRMILDQSLRAFHLSQPLRQTQNGSLIASWLLRRQWLIIITFGSTVVPVAFYVSSIIECVPLVQYTRYATLSWLSFLSAAILRTRR